MNMEEDRKRDPVCVFFFKKEISAYSCVRVSKSVFSVQMMMF